MIEATEVLKTIPAMKMRTIVRMRMKTFERFRSYTYEDDDNDDNVNEDEIRCQD